MKEPSRYFAFSSRFFLFFPISPYIFFLFPDFWQIFRCQGWHSAPLATPVATPLYMRPRSLEEFGYVYNCVYIYTDIRCYLESI